MDLIFWLDAPPVCCRGIFDIAGNKWQGKSYYVCSGQSDANRLKILGGNETFGKIQMITLEGLENKEEFVSSFIKNHLEDIHIFNGYKSSTAKYLDLLLKLNNKAKTVVWAERPCPKWKAKFPWSLYHRFYARKYKNKITAMLPLGIKGIEQYKKYGWPEEKLFPFLYLPVMNETLAESPRKEKEDKIIKFIFLGRFSAGPKGTDILMEACKYLKHNNYTLEMTGGYGDLKDAVLAWIEKMPNVSFGGTWPIAEACDRLHNYDVCIVPTRYEGWNVTVNEALMASIGCISSDEAVSDEMIKYSKAGAIVKACDAKELAQAMDKVMENPSIINEWKAAAYKYRKHMTAETNADYFIAVLNYLFKEKATGPKPKAPWII